jgi:hypothetical protein
MRKCIVSLIVVLVVCLMCVSVTNAAILWVDGAVGNWSDGTNWVGGVAPISTIEEVQINNGTVNMDCDASVGMLHMADSGTPSTNVATLNMTAAAGFTGKTLTVSKASANLFIVGYAGKGIVNQDTGTVKVFAPTGGLGAINIQYAATTPASFYNLSGGVLDTEVLRGGFTNTNLGLNDTGGTIIDRTNIYRLGSYVGSVMELTQGGSTLSPGGSAIGNTNIGASGYETKWITSASSKLQVDLALASYDTFHGSGNADLTLGTLDIMAGYTPAVNSFFDIIKLDLKAGKTGTGTFGSITDNLPGYFTAAWVNSGTTPDTLRITYIPEPATIALLGLGLLAMRRNKK